MQIKNKTVKRLSEVIGTLPPEMVSRFLTEYDAAYAEGLFEAVYLRDELGVKAGVTTPRRDELMIVSERLEKWERRTLGWIVDEHPNARLCASLSELTDEEALLEQLARARRTVQREEQAKPLRPGRRRQKATPQAPRQAVQGSEVKSAPKRQARLPVQDAAAD